MNIEYNEIRAILKETKYQSIMIGTNCDSNLIPFGAAIKVLTSKIDDSFVFFFTLTVNSVLILLFKLCVGAIVLPSIEKAKTIQRLLILSNGDPKIAAQYVEKPDLNHWMMKDLSADQLKTIKQLWG